MAINRGNMLNEATPVTMAAVKAAVAADNARYRRYRHRATGAPVAAAQLTDRASFEGAHVAEAGEWWVIVSDRTDRLLQHARTGRPVTRSRYVRIVAPSAFAESFIYDDDRPAIARPSR